MLFDAVWGNGRWFSSVSPCFNCENQRIDWSFMPCLWSRVKRLTSMASTNLQRLGCCNSHLSSSPKSLSGLLQFERQEPQTSLVFFLADWWRGQKWLLRNFSNFSSPKQPPSHVKFCLGIRINSKSTSKKNIKKHSNSILPKIVQRRNSYSNETPNKNHQKIPTSTATNP